MLKQTVTYTDYNDQQQTEVLYFNLTREEMLDLLDMLPRLEEWQAKANEPDRDLTNDEVLEFLAIIRQIVKKAYGERSEDGKHFRKSEEIFDNFKQSAVYDAFLFELFQNPNEANAFLVNILPKDLAAKAQNVDLPQGTELTAVQEEVPAYLRENREPTSEELRNMSAEELRAAFMNKSQT